MLLVHKYPQIYEYTETRNEIRSFVHTQRSVVLRNDGSVVGGGTTRHRLPQQVQEGDVIGVSYDHIELRFFLNGVDLQVASPGIKAEEVYPIVYGESIQINLCSSIS